ncbi:hypothetical protein [Ramlibacter alkalitolerans]|uniref:Uncharacterized protein n=1 Tax=Ramlibacter alkalitolerans TaxID=2039631 RepID=A0ABS1JTD9_9BURK|nr:hypothetical protein [Ramlibacter alkalitolerans]MBL0427488.1 hypothetical protein [Ramlibacter alkalitolerans]
MSFPVTLTRHDMEAFDTLDLMPLRQVVHATEASRAGWCAQGLLDGLSRPERFRILRLGTGGQILARNGLALAQAQRLLRQAYGQSIEFGTPTVHRVVDPATGAVLVPVMSLRVDAPRSFRQELLQILADRATGPRQVAVQGERTIVRTESPLEHLIGLEPQVLERSNGAARILCSLARYGQGPGSSPQGAQR